MERGGVHVEFLRLAHGGRFQGIQNLGHIITLGGQRVLHLGDAATRLENYEPYALSERSLDVALVPYWFFLEAGGRQLVDEHLHARHIIACHIPAADRDEVAEQLAKTDPRVIVPRSPSEQGLESWTIAPSTAR